MRARTLPTTLSLSRSLDGWSCQRVQTAEAKQTVQAKRRGRRVSAGLARPMANPWGRGLSASCAARRPEPTDNLCISLSLYLSIYLSIYNMYVCIYIYICNTIHNLHYIEYDILFIYHYIILYYIILYYITLYHII